MNLNPPAKVRAIVYAVTALGTPVVVYLLARNIIGNLEMNLWAAEVTAMSVMAGLNVNPK